MRTLVVLLGLGLGTMFAQVDPGQQATQQAIQNSQQAMQAAQQATQDAQRASEDAARAAQQASQAAQQASQQAGRPPAPKLATPRAAEPTFSPKPGKFATPQNVTIEAATPGATIYYTTDGRTPSESSEVYKGPISLKANAKLRAMAVAPQCTNSKIASGNYKIRPSAPKTAAIF